MASLPARMRWEVVGGDEAPPPSCVLFLKKCNHSEAQRYQHQDLPPTSLRYAMTQNVCAALPLQDFQALSVGIFLTSSYQRVSAADGRYPGDRCGCFICPIKQPCSE